MIGYCICVESSKSEHLFARLSRKNIYILIINGHSNQSNLLFDTIRYVLWYYLLHFELSKLSCVRKITPVGLISNNPRIITQRLHYIVPTDTMLTALTTEMSYEALSHEMVIKQAFIVRCWNKICEKLYKMQKSTRRILQRF